MEYNTREHLDMAANEVRDVQARVAYTDSQAQMVRHDQNRSPHSTANTSHERKQSTCEDRQNI